MRTLRFLFTLFSLSLLCSIYSPTVTADEWDKKTIITFSGPVTVSGHRLEAGTYVFKLADTNDRHVVQIFNERGDHIYATILAIPDYRVTPTDKTTIKFSETADDVSTVSRDLPAEGIPIKEWFYPGDNFGQEFRVKPAPMQVAEAAPVETAPAPVAEEKAAPPAEEEQPQAAEVQPAPLAQAQPEAEQPAQTEQAQTQPAETPKELPQTASSMPLIGFIGLVSLGVALSLGPIIKRIA